MIDIGRDHCSPPGDFVTDEAPLKVVAESPQISDVFVYGVEAASGEPITPVITVKPRSVFQAMKSASWASYAVSCRRNAVTCRCVSC